MLMFAVILNLLTALGVLAMAAKYLTASPLMEYHAEMLKAETLSPTALQIMKAHYRCLGVALVALSLLIAALAIFVVRLDVTWGKIAIVLATSIAGGGIALAGRETENVTGVKTPWRIAAGLAGLALLAFVLAMI
ncbi:hypothetical protein [Primorskyibacter sp. S187A]|uniref:hypothetical protein n=1 Tax=Primorskyibacter sp. S187A TaxID=3415130 RepID=UPI003C7D1C22